MKIGNNLESSGPSTLDLERLLRTRLLIQANSGGGKSYLLRKLLEESHGKVQQIVLDLEGEFSTLREKYDYILVGKDGDIQTDIRSAELLAKKLLETGASAIIDLYELKHHERITFVKRFLDAMVNARKELWHPCLVVVDEAHIFCPEKTKSESAASVIDIATRGRKRGYCVVLATQRLSKLHKDAAAECNNKLIGRTGLDVDMKRASEELGFTSKEQTRKLRELDPGEFFAFGPALSRQIEKMKVGKVQTAHPESGATASSYIAPPTSKIKALLTRLTDLPKQAEEELRSVADYKKKIRELQFEVRKKPVVVDEKAIQNAVARARKDVEKLFHREIADLKKLKKHYFSLLQRIHDISDVPEEEEPRPVGTPDKIITGTLGRIQPKYTDIPVAIKPAYPGEPIDESIDEDKPLRPGAMKMLQAVATFHPRSLTRAQVAALSQFSMKGGTFGTYLRELKKKGWLEESNNVINITQEGLDNVGDYEPMPTDPESLLALWTRKFRPGVGKMLRKLFEIYPNSISKEELGYETGFNVAGGTFGTYLRELKKNTLVEIEGDQVTASKSLFLED